MKPAERVAVTTFVAVAPHVAFDVFTQEIDAWWRREPRFRSGGTASRLELEPRVGGRFVEVLDAARSEVFEIGQVLVWEPPRRLVLSWRERDFAPDENTEVDIRFEPFERGTRVTLEHRGWENIPADRPTRHGYTGSAFTAMMGLRWGDLFLALAAHLGRRGPG